MSKKIVVITGSPRKNGNSFAMTEAFIKAAEAKGHTVTRFDAADMTIGGCHACETCYKTGKACSFDDDFNTIAPAALDADVIVFSPLYTGTPFQHKLKQYWTKCIHSVWQEKILLEKAAPSLLAVKKTTAPFLMVSVYLLNVLQH